MTTEPRTDPQAGPGSRRPATLRDERMRLAGTREFTLPGAGPARRAAITDATLTHLRGLWDAVGGPGEGSGIALAATGSLARGDSGPLSDLDLLLVHDGRRPEATVRELADALWYPLWDSGIGLDHAVRTAAQCRAVAKGDLTAAIGLLDLTPVVGDADVVASARAQVAHDWRASARTRFPELTDAVRTRHERLGDLAQTLQPDLKEARGGLRDLTVLRALTAAWLADRPRGAVDDAYGELLDIRDGLHVVTGRSRNRLTIDDQDAVAALLGLPDADALLTRVATAARTISHALDGTRRSAGQSQKARLLRRGPRRPVLTPLGHGLFVHDGEVVLGPGVDPGRDPLLVLRAALAAARAELPIAPRTAENLAAAWPGLPQPWPAEALELFCDLLAAGPGLVEVWEDLDQVGLVSRWLPEWDGVRSRPQRGGVHRHTVDRHTLEALVNASRLTRDVARADLLVLGVLLHDIGKIAGNRDHSAEGVPLARRALTRFGVGADDIAVVCRLVAQHLTLVELATRRDPDDPATVEAAVQAVDGDPNILDLLAAVTESDAQAAGEQAWGSWRASLVGRLVAATRERLADPARTDAVDDDALPADAAEVRASGRARVTCTGDGQVLTLQVLAPDRPGLFADTAGVLALHSLRVRSARIRTIEGLAVDEWLVTSAIDEQPDTVAIERTLARLASGDRAPMASLAALHRISLTASSRAASGAPGQARVLVLPAAGTGATVLEVRAADRMGLLHDLGRALADIGVAVRSAHVGTHAGQTLDTFYLTDADGAPLAPAQVARAVAALIDACDDPAARG